MHRRFSIVAFTLLLVASNGYARPDQARVDKAVEKGSAWVKKQQKPDGSWTDKWAPAYQTGETALSLLTLLKCGTKPEDPAIQKGFEWLLEQPFKKVYEVSVSILALEALYSPKPDKPDPANPYRTIVKKSFLNKADPRIKDWLQRATAFLVASEKADGLWAYPDREADVSNAQFALVALKSARRLGVKVDQEVFAKSVVYFIGQQEKTGPKVADFDVPAADNNIDDVEDKKAAQKTREKLKKDGTTQERPKTSMTGRGWSYKSSWGPRGSMTAAGVASLIICKSELENNPIYEKKFAAQVEKAIRDGCAWLADRFRADANPGAEPDWLFYWLYTLERAATLAGTERLGPHDWYSLGAEVILKAQKDDGHFEEGTKGELDGNLAGSCLALLFLKRSTVPVIERTATGVAGGGGEAAPGGSPDPAKPAAAGDKRLGVQVEKLEDGNFAVTFRIKPATAPSKVSVAGSFNEWNKDTTPCAAGPDGVWEATVRMKAGKFTYKFVLNGSEWILDPANKDSVDDGNG
ncbi:MAG: hypothetical protein ACAI25_00120, partial [Planctomycetota bacterium]